MFEIGDYVVYGSNGVCKITKIGHVDLPGISQEKLYYTMKPCYVKSSEISAPVDNRQVVLRKVMSKEEASEFVQEIPKIKKIQVTEEKKRETMYKEALYSCEPVRIASLIKTIGDRIKERQAEGKKVTSSDSRFFHMAEDSLFGELAISLEMNKEDVGAFIENEIHRLQAVS